MINKMENENVYKSTANRIIETGYKRAEDMYSNWTEYVDELELDSDFNKSDFFKEDGTPVYDTILEHLIRDLGMTKMHMYPEDVIGDDASDEENECYSWMDDLEVADLLEEGIKKYLNSKYK